MKLVNNTMIAKNDTDRSDIDYKTIIFIQFTYKTFIVGKITSRKNKIFVLTVLKTCNMIVKADKIYRNCEVLKNEKIYDYVCPIL